MADSTPAHTPGIHVRIPRALWDAYGRVCARKGRDRTEDLLVHIRRQIELLGDDQDRAALADAEQELAERRARRGGRPPKAQARSHADQGDAKGDLAI
jgi:hypothetical protein